MVEKTTSLKVFVSYSRADVAFADQLVLALEDKGFEAILDRHDISGAENWRERLGKLILSADAVAFVLTARSAASDICLWEVEEAQRLGKRIIPLTPAALGGVAPPQALSELNWIPFYEEPAIPGSGFYYGVKRLNEALSVDLDWLRAQTRYSERALEWARQKTEDLLLRGEALKEAEAWLARTPAGSSPPDTVREYLAASGDAEQRRQAAAKAQLEERENALKIAEAAVADSKKAQEKLRRFSLWALVAGVILLAIAIPGNYFAATRTLDANDRRAALFADAANDLTRQGDYSRGLLMALAGDPQARSGWIEDLMRPEGNIAARNALERAYAGDRSVATAVTGSPGKGLVSLPDGKRFLTLHDDGVRLWTAGAMLDPVKLAVDQLVVDAFPMKDGDNVILRLRAEEEERFIVWSLARNAVVRPIGPVFSGDSPGIHPATLSREGDWLVTAEGARLSVWNTADGAKVKDIDTDISWFMALAASSEEDLVTASTGDERVLTWGVSSGEITGPVESAFGDVTVLVAVESSDVVFGASNGQVGSVESTARLTPAFQSFGEELMNPQGVDVMRVGVDERGVLMVSDDGQVKLLDMLTASWDEPFGRRSDVVGADFATANGMVAALTDDGVVLVASFGSTAKPQMLAELFAGEQNDELASQGAVFFSGPTGIAALATEKMGTLVWEPGKDVLAKFSTGWTDEKSAIPAAIAVSDDGNTLVMAQHVRVDVWKAGQGERVATYDVGSEASVPVEVKVLSGGSAFFYRNSEGQAGARKIDTGEVIFPEREFGFDTITPNADGTIIAQLGRLGELSLHRAGVTEPEVLKTQSPPRAVAFSDDGRMMAVAMEDGAVDLWRIGETRPFQSVKAHRGQASRVVFHKDGRMFATGGYDGRIRLWKVDDRDPVQTFDLPQDTAATLAIDAAGSKIIALENTGVVQFPFNPIIGAPADEQVRLACERLEARGVAGFSDQDYSTYAFLEKVPPDPCETLGLRKAKPQASQG